MRISTIVKVWVESLELVASDINDLGHESASSTPQDTKDGEGDGENDDERRSPKDEEHEHPKVIEREGRSDKSLRVDVVKQRTSCNQRGEDESCHENAH